MFVVSLKFGDHKKSGHGTQRLSPTGYPPVGKAQPIHKLYSAHKPARAVHHNGTLTAARADLCRRTQLVHLPGGAHALPPEIGTPKSPPADP